MSKEEEERIAKAVAGTEEPDQGRAPDKDDAAEGHTQQGTVIIPLLVLVSLVVAVVVVCLVYTGMSHHSVKERCSMDAASLEESSASRAALWRKAWAVSSDQVKDAKTVVAMARAVKDAGGIKPETVRCDASMSTKDLKAAKQKAEDLDSKYDKLDKAAKAVLTSRDAKDLDDARTALGVKREEASRLLSDSDGKVADNTTREALQKAIILADLAKGKAKDYRDAAGPLQAAIDQVNASMQAKAQADQQAAEQAAQQAAPSYGGGYTPSYRPSYGQGGGGGWSAPAPVQQPAPSTSQGSSQKWNDFINRPDNTMHGCRPDGGCGIG